MCQRHPGRTSTSCCRPARRLSRDWPSTCSIGPAARLTSCLPIIQNIRRVCVVIWLRKVVVLEGKPVHLHILQRNLKGKIEIRLGYCVVHCLKYAFSFAVCFVCVCVVMLSIPCGSYDYLTNILQGCSLALGQFNHVSATIKLLKSYFKKCTIKVSKWWSFCADFIG